MFSVLLKPSHPTGVYHRAGMEFTRGAAVLMETVPEAIEKDEWLVVTKVAEPIGAQETGEGRTFHGHQSTKGKGFKAYQPDD